MFRSQGDEDDNSPKEEVGEQCPEEGMEELSWCQKVCKRVWGSGRGGTGRMEATGQSASTF